MMKAWMRHTLFWIIFMIVQALEWGNRDTLYNATMFELLFLPVRLIAVYANWFYLQPKLLYKNKTWQYAFGLIFMVVALAILQRFFTLYWGYPMFFPKWVKGEILNPWLFFRIAQNVIIILFPVVFTTGYKLFIDWYAQRERAQQLEKEKIQTELKYLKAQLNPHFLFNNLNNIYGLAREKSDKAPRLILKLSDILSFTLYESSVPKIALQKELDMMRNLVELEKDRYGERVNIHLDLPPPPASWQIAPLLLMPLVENAFKHGVREATEKAHVEIRTTYEENIFAIEIKNSIAQAKTMASEEHGIGLSNLRKRLQLIYPEAYTFENFQDHHTYVARLKIEMT